MSSKQHTHEQLVALGVTYLSTTGGFRVVCREMHSGLREIPDVYAIDSKHSVVVECKTTHSDFVRDAKKSFRRRPKEGLGMYRYYLCPEGVIDEKELPPKWGLIYVYENGNVRLVKGKVFGNKKNDGAYRFQVDYRRECVALYGLLRRAVTWDVIGRNGEWRYNPDEQTTDV